MISNYLRDFHNETLVEEEAVRIDSNINLRGHEPRIFLGFCQKKKYFHCGALKVN